MGDGITDFIDDNRSAALSTNTTIAAVGIQKVAGRVAGAFVQPAVGALDHAANDTGPDGLDVGLYALGLLGSFVGIAAAGTGIVKSLVDDDTRRRLEQARACERSGARRFVLACIDYGYAGQGINAMNVAQDGGTAWRHPNSLWVYITDAKGRLVCDYKPEVATEIYQPILPLRPVGDGKFRWHSLRG